MDTEQWHILVAVAATGSCRNPRLYCKGYVVAVGGQIGHRTRTRATRGAKTTGVPLPLEFPERKVKVLQGYTAGRKV
jgi:hypothetical protein